MRTFIIPTSQVEHLRKNILAKTEAPKVILAELSKDGKRYFPDGEVYMRILKANRLKGKRVIVLHSGAPKPNEGLVELELILQILKDYKIKPEVFFSYFPYGKQDEVFEEGETNAAKNLIEKLTRYYKAKKIYTVDAHFLRRKWVKKYPIVSLSAIPILIEKAKENFGKNILFLTTGASGRRYKINSFNKIRKNSCTIKLEISNKFKKIIKGRIIGVVDDLLETGGTLLKVYDVCKKLKAKNIICLVTHGVLRKGILRIKENYSHFYLTNTINQKESNIDITDLILNTLQKYD
ncbi:ribose-phosphate pyrophosphokinase-like domain-containing protein [Patescibacteria group bacterium]|nr:ribose-phosphate pyrophosphokinase-like domain-containing protein [Patescibacteria group bacterium]